MHAMCFVCGAVVPVYFAMFALAGVAGSGLAFGELEAWLSANPVVTLGGETDKLFDLTEEMGAQAVVEVPRQVTSPVALLAEMLCRVWRALLWLVGLTAAAASESATAAASPFVMGEAAAARRAAFERSGRRQRKRRKPSQEAEWRQLEAAELVVRPRPPRQASVA